MFPFNFFVKHPSLQKCLKYLIREGILCSIWLTLQLVCILLLFPNSSGMTVCFCKECSWKRSSAEQDRWTLGCIWHSPAPCTPAELTIWFSFIPKKCHLCSLLSKHQSIVSENEWESNSKAYSWSYHRSTTHTIPVPSQTKGKTKLTECSYMWVAVKNMSVGEEAGSPTFPIVADVVF